MTGAAAPSRVVYPHPPVVEVICQVTFAEPVHWSVASPGMLYAAIESEYPGNPRTQSSVQATFNADDGQFMVNQGNVLFVYSNESESKRLVANESCLSVNALQPYEEWPSVAERFQRAISAFQFSIGNFVPASVNLRYINRIVIPQSGPKIEEYFTIPIAKSKQAETVVQGFITRSQSVSTESSISTTITFASQEHAVADESAFILDIELAAPTSNEATMEDLIASIARLHRLENVEFESSLTQKCRELFV